MFGSRLMKRASGGTVLVLAASLGLGGCAAAVGAAMAAGDIRRGVGGIQQLIASTRDLPDTAGVVFVASDSPIAGTYRGYQVLEGDTVRYYIRTARQPIAPIVDEEGGVTGYALHAVAAVTLETLESRVQALSNLASESVEGRAIFFIEGTQPPNVTGRTLYPAAFLGQVGAGESPIADRHDEVLRELEIEMAAPDFIELENQAIPHELFGSVAEGVFTVNSGGAAVYEQEADLEDGGAFILHFERISRTTLP